MKTNHILKTLALLFFVTSATAQQGINYKAIINDAGGNVLANTAITIQFTILENGTASVYQESHSTTTDANGIIIVNIGEGTPQSGDFNTIDWGSNPHFLKTEIDKGNGLTDMGTTEFKVVPYALFAEETQKLNVSGTGDTLYLSKSNWVIVPGVSMANDKGTDSSFIVDIDGNVYKTVEINSLTWMAENLRATHYNDGTPIQNVTDNEDWMYLSSDAYCWYNNDSVSNAATYGALYNGYVVTKSKNVCPENWHVAFEGDVLSLINSESLDIVGGMLKETGIDHWQSPNMTVDNNKYGFSALPGGWRAGEVQFGEFWSIKQFVSFWQNNGGLPKTIGYFSVSNNSTELTNRLATLLYSNSGRSIRCVKDY